MNKVIHRYFHIKSLLWTLMALFLVSYFIFHTMEGQRSFFVLKTIESQNVDAEKKLSFLKKEREKLTRVAQGLNPKALDKELLDQYARQNLGYIMSDEVLVIVEN